MTWTFARLSVLAVVAACVMAPNAVSASVTSAGQAAFCEVGRDLEQELQEAGRLQVRDKADVRTLRRIVRTSAPEAPPSLQPAFTTLLRFYDRILAGKIASEGGTDAARDRFEPAVRRAGRAGFAIVRYLEKQCGFVL